MIYIFIRCCTLNTTKMYNSKCLHNYNFLQLHHRQICRILRYILPSFFIPEVSMCLCGHHGYHLLQVGYMLLIAAALLGRTYCEAYVNTTLLSLYITFPYCVYYIPIPCILHSHTSFLVSIPQSNHWKECR